MATQLNDMHLHSKDRVQTIKLNDPLAGNEVEIKVPLFTWGIELPEEKRFFGRKSINIAKINGNGIGPEIIPETRKAMDLALELLYGDKHQLCWSVMDTSNIDNLIEELAPYEYAIKGPMATPVGGGHGSYNVEIRKRLQLGGCMRRSGYFKGLELPYDLAHLIHCVIFRELQEDAPYCEKELASRTEDARKLAQFCKQEFGWEISESAAIGLRPFTPEATMTIAIAGASYAMAHGYKYVTVHHKANIGKHTDGAFRAWALSAIKQCYGDAVITTEEALDSGKIPDGKFVLRDSIVDAAFFKMVKRPQPDEVVIDPNMFGDIISDMLAGISGGSLGNAPGLNFGVDEHGNLRAHAEATAGTAPDIAGKGIANPAGSMMSGGALLGFMGCNEAKHLINEAIDKVYLSHRGTADVKSYIMGCEVLSTEQFGHAVREEMRKLVDQGLHQRLAS